jgi:hypothetical protein
VPNKKNLPKEVVEHWPEVLKDVDIKVVPVKYLHAVRVYFKNGKVWDIDVAKTLKKNPSEKSIEHTLEQIFLEYEDTIQNIDFRLDTAKIKADIQARTKYFMKKRR